ncbi:MAG: RNA polymerase subunit sigma-70, partial [Geminicoccales bacterium]
MASDQTKLARNLKRVGHLDIPGGGQVVVSGNYAFIGHMKPPHGTSILDVSDPAKPRLVCQVETPSPLSHTHKVRVVGDIMITNVEQDRRHFLRKAERIPVARAEFEGRLGRPPSDNELAGELGVEEGDIADLESFRKNGYHEGGFRVWDISRPSAPKLLNYQLTHGFGVHRFDMDAGYAFISTEMKGFIGNILVIYDIADPEKPCEVSRWWMPGQHLAGGEKPTWRGYSHRLHHALRVGDQLWASVWHAGLRVIDISDISTPTTVGAYSYHPWVVEPTHTVLPAAKTIGGRRVAAVADEEHEHRRGQPHAGLWLFDVTDVDNMQPLSTFHVSEMDSPWSRATGRFGMHQFQEHIDGMIAFCAWFGGGLRVVDFSDPTWPK